MLPWYALNTAMLPNVKAAAAAAAGGSSSAATPAPLGVIMIAPGGARHVRTRIGNMRVECELSPRIVTARADGHVRVRAAVAAVVTRKRAVSISLASVQPVERGSVERVLPVRRGSIEVVRPIEPIARGARRAVR